MQTEQQVFKRVEKKYLVSRTQYDQIISAVREHTDPDKHKGHTIFSLYYDTPDHLLIRRSIDKPVYKEKLRLRAYGVPEKDTPVFAEIKKKYKKVVYKRRVKMPYEDALAFLHSGNIPAGYESQRQIMSEIAWFLRSYPNLAPSMLISYERTAFYGVNTPDLRITFDNNLLWRDAQFIPITGAWGTPLLNEDVLIMEIKLSGAMPLWLVDLLTSAKIYPTSFSKYGTAYKTKLLKGDIHYA